MKKISILDLPEDLLEDAPISYGPQAPTTKGIAIPSSSHSSTRQTAMEILIAELAQALGIDMQELIDWGKDNPILTEVLKTILLTAKRLKLNPLLGHIAWKRNTENQWEVYIPMDGWIALIHREPSFQGISFNQSSETENGVPIWMECSIYRSNLMHPITVREYYAELKTDHRMWAQMPRRMLRLKTLQQCARLAFGISMLHTQPIKSIESTRKQKDCHEKKGLVSTKQLLREKLFANSSKY